MAFRLLAPLALALGALTFSPVHAQSMDHSQHGAGVSAHTPASTRAYLAANEAMHRDMAIDFTGNADVDFLRGMIPHHQGAVEMARAVLEHGSDPQVRELAEQVIAAQQAEIEWMQTRLRELGHQ